MSPRAAWRLESLGFGEVYDYVGSKMEWIGAGLPWEGSDASEPTLGALAHGDVALCALDDMLGAVMGRLGQRPIALVVNSERIVLGLVRREVAGPDEALVCKVMEEGPSTYRPHVPATEMAERLTEHPQGHIVVTTLDGRLVGMTSGEEITRVVREREQRPAGEMDR